jgi:hypothetical protein
VDQEPLSRPQLRLAEQGVVSRDEHLRQAARLRPVERLRHRHRGPLVDERQLRLGAAAHNRHHPVPFLEALGPRPARGDLAGQLEPGDVLRRARRRRVGALALEHVGAVETGGAHPH